MYKTFLTVPAITCLAVLPALLGSVGCASHKEKTTVETTTVHEDGDTTRSRYGDSGDREVSTTTTKTETVESDRDDPDRGLFGIVGNIIALPFRAVGALFSAIF